MQMYLLRKGRLADGSAVGVIQERSEGGASD